MISNTDVLQYGTDDRKLSGLKDKLVENNPLTLVFSLFFHFSNL